FKEIAEYFQPDVILTQNGADAHVYDPLTHLCGTMAIYERIPLLAKEIANQYCEGKWIATGGGGYDIWRVVPRAWAQIWSVMLHDKVIKGDIPKSWLDKWQPEAPVQLPTTWHDANNAFPTIPRKAEIEEKNAKLLESLLKFTRLNNTK